MSTAVERARARAREAFARVQARHAQSAIDTARPTDAAALVRPVEGAAEPPKGGQQTEGTADHEADDR